MSMAGYPLFKSQEVRIPKKNLKIADMRQKMFAYPIFKNIFYDVLNYKIILKLKNKYNK